VADIVSKTCDKKIPKGRKKVPCGQPVPGNEATAITVGTTRYLMDLCDEHKAELMAAVEPFTEVAHDAQKRTGTQVRKAIQGKGGKAFTAADVREWMKDQGREISGTGRLPASVIREFQDAHK
jgi:hypothetical protein